MRQDDGIDLSGGIGNCAQLRNRRSLSPWNRPQSTSTRVPPCSSRYFDPVTVRAAPINVRSATGRRYQAYQRSGPGVSANLSRMGNALRRAALWLAVVAGAVSLSAQSRSLLTVDAIYHPEQRVAFSGFAEDDIYLARPGHIRRRPAIRERIRVAEGGRRLRPDITAVRRRPAWRRRSPRCRA